MAWQCENNKKGISNPEIMLDVDPMEITFQDQLPAQNTGILVQPSIDTVDQDHTREFRECALNSDIHPVKEVMGPSDFNQITPLTKYQRLATDQKRQYKDGDICPEKRLCRCSYNATAWHNTNGKTKKAHAKNMQTSIVLIFIVNVGWSVFWCVLTWCGTQVMAKASKSVLPPENLGPVAEELIIEVTEIQLSSSEPSVSYPCFGGSWTYIEIRLMNFFPKLYPTQLKTLLWQPCLSRWIISHGQIQN